MDHSAVITTDFTGLVLSCSFIHIDSTNVGTNTFVCDHRLKENKLKDKLVLDRLCGIDMFDYTHKEIGIFKPTGKHIGVNAHELQSAYCEWRKRRFTR